MLYEVITIKMLVSLFGTSQFLSRIFIQHPEILDALVSRAYAVSFKNREEMAHELAELLGAADDYEEKLEVLRRFRKEQFLRIAIGDTWDTEKIIRDMHENPQIKVITIGEAGENLVRYACSYNFV